VGEKWNQSTAHIHHQPVHCEQRSYNRLNYNLLPPTHLTDSTIRGLRKMFIQFFFFIILEYYIDILFFFIFWVFFYSSLSSFTYVFVYFVFEFFYVFLLSSSSCSFLLLKLLSYLFCPPPFFASFFYFSFIYINFLTSWFILYYFCHFLFHAYWLSWINFYCISISGWIWSCCYYGDLFSPLSGTVDWTVKKRLLTKKTLT
jgi:hypothetical protein